MLRELLERLQKDPLYTSYGVLAHFFVFCDEQYQPTGEWQIGFYKKEECSSL